MRVTEYNKTIPTKMGIRIANNFTHYDTSTTGSGVYYVNVYKNERKIIAKITY